MKNFIRDYLTFNKRERNGVFVLLAIITLLTVYLNISFLFNKTEITDFTKFEKEIEHFNTSAKEISDSLKEEKENKFKQYVTSINVTNPKPQYFKFDPNHLPDNDWKRLGLSERQIKTIKNYESKGGKFKTKEDVKKMYCIKEATYNLLEPFIQITPIQTKFSKYTENNKALQVLKSELAAKSLPISIELNSADSTMLTKVKGIGPFYAKAIIKYRNQIGGFIAKEQLMELWKFDSIKYQTVQRFISIDVSLVKKININSCTTTELKHPYLNWNIVNAIVNYRSKHGKYKTIEDIKKTDLVNDGTYNKIAPYLIAN